MIERFVQVETGLRRSKLVDRMNADLDVHPAVLIGSLVLLWSAVLDARAGGDLSERSDRWIEDAAGWPGEPGAFAKAIRKHHLDEHGVIRDWNEKYGKLDVERGKAAKLKADQRARERAARDGQAAVAPVSTGQTEDRPEISSISQSVSHSVDLEKGKGVQGEGGPREPMEHLRERFGEFAEWPIALVRAARQPFAVAGHMIGHLDGLHGPVYSAEVIALAAMEYAASEHAGEGFKARLFAGFVRRAEDTLAKKQGRVQQQNETRFIRHEQEVQDSVDREIAADEALIARAQKLMRADEYERFVREAEMAVPSKWTGKVREAMVRTELARRIREYTDLDNDGGARAAS